MQHYRGYGASSRMAANSNDALWKLAFGAVGLFIGAFIGASMPNLVFKPTQTQATTTSASTSQSINNDSSDASDEILCAGPECVSLPPPKIPNNLISVSLPSSYQTARISLVARSASMTAEIINIERFALLVTVINNHSEVLTKLHSEQYSELESLTINSGYSIKNEIDMTVTSLKTCITSGNPVIVKLQSLRETSSSLPDSGDDDEIDWLKVNDSSKNVLIIGYDSFYIYMIDNYVSDSITFCPTREFSRRWHSLNARGARVTGEATIIEKNSASSLSTTTIKSKSLMNAKLIQLQ